MLNQEKLRSTYTQGSQGTVSPPDYDTTFERILYSAPGFKEGDIWVSIPTPNLESFLDEVSDSSDVEGILGADLLKIREKYHSEIDYTKS